jgi:hypothetical protein
MFSSQLEKIIDLAKRTGDKMIVMPEFGEPFAIVPIEKYEAMVSDQTDYAGMTEEEILNRVNREISLWKQAQREIGLGTDMDFFSPRDLGEDLMPRLPFGKDEEPAWLKEEDEEDIFGKKTFDPLADDDDEDEDPSTGEAGWTPPKWPEDFMDDDDDDLKKEDFKVEEIKEPAISAGKEKNKDNWKVDESVFPADDEPLDDEWLNETTVGDINYEAEKPAEANKDINKDLPIIEADAERGEDEPLKKSEDEFLVEPIE